MAAGEGDSRDKPKRRTAICLRVCGSSVCAGDRGAGEALPRSGSPRLKRQRLALATQLGELERPDPGVGTGRLLEERGPALSVRAGEERIGHHEIMAAAIRRRGGR